MLDESKSSSHSLLGVACATSNSSQSIVPLLQLKKSFPVKSFGSALTESEMISSHFSLPCRRECKSTSDDTHTFEIKNNESASRSIKVDLICNELFNTNNLRSRLNRGKFGYNPLRKFSSKKSSPLNNLNLFNSSKLKRLQAKAIHEKKISDCKILYYENKNILINFSKDNHNKKLFQAVSSNDPNTVTDLLDSSMFDVNCHDDKQRTCLHIACSRGYLDIVKLLLEYGANPNIRDCVSNLPIHLAIISSHVPVVTLLLEAGADIHSLDTNGKTVLHLAGTRLRWLLNDENHKASPKLKFEAIMIMNMIKEYLKRKKTSNTDLDYLANQLENSFNLDDINCLTKKLLNQFETFNISSNNLNSKQQNVSNVFSK